jgi:thiol-disulfide isomerase/thioredoxin
MRPGRRKALLLAGIGAAAAAAGALVGALALQSRTGAAQLLSASFPDLEGRTRRVLDWRGQVLVCNFWATWCAPCREEIPLLVAAKQQYANKGLEVLGIGIDNADKISEFAAIYKVNYPILISGSSAIDLMRELGNRGGGLPYTVFLDRTGSVAHRKIGALRQAELDEILAALLG